MVYIKENEMEAGIEALALAVVVQAIKDGVRQKNVSHEVKNFLYSDWCYLLCGCSGDYLMNLIERKKHEKFKRNDSTRT